MGSLVALTLLLRFWQPARSVAVSRREPQRRTRRPTLSCRSARTWQMAYAWMPWLLLSLMVFLWGWPAWKTMLNGGPEQPNCLAGISRLVPSAVSARAVYRTAPAVAVPPGADRAARAGAGDLRVQLAVGDRHRHLPGGRALGLLAADRPGGRSSRQFVETL